MTEDPRSGQGARGRGVLATILRYELKMLLRDTRTLLIAVVAPLVIFPVWVLITRSVERSESRRLDRTEYRYAVEGSQAEWAGALVREALRLERENPDTARAAATFTEVRVADPDSALQRGALHLVVEGYTTEEFRELVLEERAERRARATAADSSGAPSPEAPLPPAAPAVRIRYRGVNDFSERAREILQERLIQVRVAMRDSVYAGRGFPVAQAALGAVETEDVATAERQAGAFLGLAMTPLLLLLMLSGGSIVAADAISGEKERGTLETLLTTAASRREIVEAKQLAVMVVGFSVAAVNVANLAFYLGLGVVRLPASMQIDLGWDQVVLLFLLFLPLAMLVAAVLLLLSGVSKSYREYQIYFFPVFLCFLVPSLAPILPGMELRSAIALVPIAGIGVAVRDILLGNVDPLMAGAAFLSTLAAAAWFALLTQRTLSNERLISRSELDEADLLGGAALFPRHVFQWFLGLWVVFFLVSLWFGEALGVRGQIVVNLLGIFLGGSIFLLVRYRLPVTEALSLRAPHPAAWVATLVGAPSALVLGMGVAEMVNTYLFPVPDEMIQAFGQALTVTELPLWQLLLFLAVLPAVLEEVAFRGVLLHGARKRLGPWGTALVVGAVFGFFHVALFRIVPTALLGVALAWVVLLTRSLYPAMLWHFLNNAAALVPASLGWVPDDFAVPAWGTGLAVAGLGTSFWILWRTGPGRRPQRGAPGAAPRPGG